MDRIRHLESNNHGWGLYYPICALDLGWPYVAGYGVVGRSDFALAVETGKACQFCQEIYERKRLYEKEEEK